VMCSGNPAFMPSASSPRSMMFRAAFTSLCNVRPWGLVTCPHGLPHDLASVVRAFPRGVVLANGEGGDPVVLEGSRALRARSAAMFAKARSLRRLRLS
jgi:hypothetical protein